MITTENYPLPNAIPIEEIIRIAPRTVAERIDKALINFATISQELGHAADVTANDYSLAYATDVFGLNMVVVHLAQAGLATLLFDGEQTCPPSINPYYCLAFRPGYKINVTLTVSGWNAVQAYLTGRSAD